MTTKFKDKQIDVDEIYLKRDDYVIGGAVAACGATNVPFRQNSHFYLNYSLPYIVESLDWIKANTHKHSIAYTGMTSEEMYLCKSNYTWYRYGNSTNYKGHDAYAATTWTASSPMALLSGTWLDIQPSYESTFGINSSGQLFGRGDDFLLGISPTYKHSETSWGLFPSDKLIKKACIPTAGATNEWEVAGFIIDVNGVMWAAGDGSSGQLGNGQLTLMTSWVQVLGGNTWKDVVACRNANTKTKAVLAIDTSGRLWGWGSNSAFILGTGAASTAYYSTPVQIGTATNWSRISIGDHHAMGIRSPGLLYVWGLNTNYALGTGVANSTHYSTPVQLGTLSSWIWIAAGNGNSSAIRWATSVATSGSLYSWGTNTSGILGDGTTVSKSTPVAIGAASIWLQVEKDTMSGVAAAALQTNGRVVTWGYNDIGQLGHGDVVNRSTPTLVANMSPATFIGMKHGALAIVKTNTLYFAGNNWNGGWGNDLLYGLTYSVPTMSVSNRSIVYATKGFHIQEIAPGSGYLYQSYGNSGTVHGGIDPTSHYLYYCQSSWVQLGSGYSWLAMDVWSYHAHFIRDDRTLWTIGMTSAALLGNGTTTASVSSLVQITTNKWLELGGSAEHKLAIDTSGRLWAWGKNTGGQLGVGNTTSTSTPIQVGSSSAWTRVFHSPYGTSYAQQGTTTYVWGTASYGLLWDTNGASHGYSTPVALTTTWSKIHGVGGNHAVGIKPDGTLWGVGYSLSDNRTLEMEQVGFLPYAVYSSPVLISSKNRWVDAWGYSTSTGILAGGE